MAVLLVSVICCNEMLAATSVAVRSNPHPQPFSQAWEKGAEGGMRDVVIVTGLLKRLADVDIYNWLTSLRWNRDLVRWLFRDGFGCPQTSLRFLTRADDTWRVGCYHVDRSDMWSDLA